MYLCQHPVIPWIKQKLNHCSSDLHLPPNMLLFRSSHIFLLQHLYGRLTPSPVSPLPATIASTLINSSEHHLPKVLHCFFKNILPSPKFRKIAEGWRLKWTFGMSHHHLPWQSWQLWVVDNGARDTNLVRKCITWTAHNIQDSGVAIVSAVQVHNLLDTLELTVSVAFKLWILWRQKLSLSCNSPSAFSLPYRQHGSY